MGKLLNLTGRRFNRLTVLERAGSDTRNKPLWRCVCDCGSEKIAKGDLLRGGHTKSCGCLPYGGSFGIDLSGQRFGRLVAIQRVEDRIKPNGAHATQWLFACDCGVQTVKLAGNVRKGTTLSCGCLAKEAVRAANARQGANSYISAHARVKYAKGRAKEYDCVDCGGPAREWSYDGLDPDEQLGGTTGKCPYSVDPAHYAPRCTRCHRAHDRDLRAS